MRFRGLKLAAMVAAGLGVFSSQSMVDLYSQIYDSTDPGDLGDSDAWQLRQAYVGKELLELETEWLQKQAELEQGS